MKDLVRVAALLIVASLLGACGGIGAVGGGTAGADTAQPLAESHAWDSWNWDEGSFED
ncbi:MAG TPA: hypothetical protein VGO61_14580 [Steroidobacteraceae bacterium]|jgi:hypothetical protein|nr:hypothetical protein [Steroidobacteraceae bacterium]